MPVQMLSWQAAVSRVMGDLLSLKPDLGVTDAQIAEAIAALLQGRAHAPPLAYSPAARPALLRAVWLFFVAAPRIMPRSLALVPMQLQLLEAGEGELSELLDFVGVSVLTGGPEDAAELARLLTLSGEALDAAVSAGLAGMRGADLDARINAVAREIVAELVAEMPLFRDQLDPAIALGLAPASGDFDGDPDGDDGDLDLDELDLDALDDEDAGDEDTGDEDELSDDDEGDEDDEEDGLTEIPDEAILMLLRPGVRDEDVRRAAASAKLVFRELRAATPRQHLRVEWATQGGRHQVTSAYDTALDVRYLVLTGDDPLSVAADLGALLDAEIDLELLARLRATRDREAMLAGLARLSLISELRPDAPVGPAIQAALEHPDAEVRHAALMFSPPDVIDMLEESVLGIALSDPDPRVRAMASRCLGQPTGTPSPADDLSVSARLAAVRPIARRALARFVWEHGLWLDEISPAAAESALTITWLGAGGRTVLHYVEDEHRGVQLLVIRGDHDGALLRRLRAAFPLVAAAALPPPSAPSRRAAAPLKLAAPAAVTLREVSERAAQLGWIWTDAERDDAGVTTSVTWASPHGARITLRLGIATALWFEGAGAEAAAAEGRAALGLRSPRELLEELAGELDAGARQQALLALSAVAPARRDEEIEGAILRATRDPEPAVRWEAVRAAGGTGWRELLPRLAEVAAGDPDPHVRKLAGTVVGLMGEGR